MPEITSDEVDRIMSKYKNKLNNALQSDSENYSNENPKAISSREYNQFKEEIMPKHMSLYEKACNFSEGIIKLTPDKKKAQAIQKSINTCHLEITPTGVVSLAALLPLGLIFLGTILSMLIPILFGATPMLSFFILFLLMGGVSYPILTTIPDNLATSWRMKASSQMVISVFYMVTFMRHTPNLENALNFAIEHIDPPLSLDLRKVLWNVETEKMESIKQSLDEYLETWREYALEYVEAMHIVESSLYESSDERRIEVLDKSLTYILDETYEKMLHYAHDLNGPITTLHMLGVVLPVLGLVILPFIVSFVPSVQWYHIAIIYNIILPMSVYYLGKKILLTRPAGAGGTTSKEGNINKEDMTVNILNKKVSVFKAAIAIWAVLFIIGLFPLILHAVAPDFDLCFNMESGSIINNEQAQQNLAEGKDKGVCFLDYIPETVDGEATGNIIGPFGVGASFFSIFIPISFAIALSFYFKRISRKAIKKRNETRKIENGFGSALFQLGNRLGDGVPAEMAFDRVSSVMKDTPAGNFFAQISMNIKRLGMSIYQAIFDPRTGAILNYPSDIIKSSMKVLVDSVKKGPTVAANALVNMSRYIKQIHLVEERIRDLLGEQISSMNSQIKFLLPVIAGIVIGITSMITTILAKLGIASGKVGEQGDNPMTSFFQAGVPPYFFQIVVGIYVVQIVYVLTVIGVGIESGSDKATENYRLGQNLYKSPRLYCIIALVIMIIFNIIASTIISQMSG